MLPWLAANCEDKKVTQPGFNPFRFYRATEKDAACQSILGTNKDLMTGHGCRPECVMGDIMMRLPGEVSHLMDMLEPTEDMSASEVNQCFMNMRNVVAAHSEHLGRAKKQWCLTCEESSTSCLVCLLAYVFTT